MKFLIILVFIANLFIYNGVFAQETRILSEIAEPEQVNNIETNTVSVEENQILDENKTETSNKDKVGDIFGSNKLESLIKENQEKQTIVDNLEDKNNKNKADKEEQKAIKNNENLNKTRNKILEEFKSKLIENQKKEKKIEKSKIEAIDEEFAKLLEEENEKEVKKLDKTKLNNFDEKILDMATTPISEEEVKNKEKYKGEIENNLNKMKEDQRNEITKLNNTIQNNNKIQIEKKDRQDKQERINNNQINSDVFNITDTGVTEELLYTSKFQKLINDYNIILKKTQVKQTEKEALIVPVEKQINKFITSDIPEELLTYERSEDNQHIPTILSMEDFQYIAKKAIDEDDLNILRGIIDITKNPDYILKNGQTLLNYTATTDCKEILKYLIYSGANLNMQNLFGNTALHNAILQNQKEIVKILVKNNANLNIFNIDGYTPLMLSIVEGKNDIAFYLLKFKQDLFLKNYRGETALSLAEKYNRIIIKEVILKIIQEENK